MTGKNVKQRHRKYDSAFKEEVLKMVASGRPVSEIAQSLGIGDNLIYRWKKNISGSSAVSSDQKTDLFTENQHLKAELRRTEQERDILKKALGIFSRGI